MVEADLTGQVHVRYSTQKAIDDFDIQVCMLACMQHLLMLCSSHHLHVLYYSEIRTESSLHPFYDKLLREERRGGGIANYSYVQTLALGHILALHILVYKFICRLVLLSSA